MANKRTIERLTPRQRSLAFSTIMLAFTIDVVDSTIVNTAIPVIQTDLAVDANAIQWVVAAYFLSFAVLLIAGGRLGDLFGYRRLFLIGVATFTAASIGCGLAETAEQLVLARLLQGATAAIMAPQVMALVQVMYAPVERVGRLAAFGIVGGLAAILGPILGGFLIAIDVADLGWRSIFLINAPIGVAALVAGWYLLPEGRSSHPLTIDVVGTLLLFAGLTALLVPLIQGGEAGWPWWCFALLLASLASGLVFWSHQRRRTQRVGSALIAPEILTERCFSLGLATTLLFATASTGFLLTFSLTLQHGLGYTPLDAALLHMPFGLGVMAGISQIGRKMLPRFGKRVPIVGAAIMAPSCVAVAVAASAAAGPLALSILLFIAGIGMGTLAGPMPPITLARVDRGHAGVAGAMHKATQQVGGALGGAVIGTLYFQTVGSTARPELFRDAFPLASVAVAALLAGASVALARLPRDIFAVRQKG